MLLEFSIENFFSYKDKTFFSMLANKTKGLEKNYYEVDNYRILKSAAIYGANASGKSNLFHIMGYICHMISNSNRMDINDKLPIIPFLDNKDKFSKFEIRFLVNKIKYVYGFSANKDKVDEEYLYYYPNGRETKIFDRTNTSSYSFPQKDNKILNEIKDKTAANKFFLSTATNWNYEKTKPAYDFITLGLGVCTKLEDLTYLAFKWYANDPDGKYKKSALKFLEKADLNIKDFEITYIDSNDIINPVENKKKESYRVLFTHEFNGKEYKLNYYNESLGTQMIFTLIPFIYITFDYNGVLFVDELDRSLHPALVEFILSIFNSEDNKGSAQLIFNTHDTNLLNLELLRRDQIWFVEKDYKLGSSDLYSLADFSVRNNENIEKGYILGRYGAIPFIVNE